MAFIFLPAFPITAADPSPVLRMMPGRQQFPAVGIHPLHPFSSFYSPFLFGKTRLFIKIPAKGIQFLHISMYNKIYKHKEALTICIGAVFIFP